MTQAAIFSEWYSLCNGPNREVVLPEVCVVQCPFLRKASVKFCGLCRRTMIPLNGSVDLAEQCSGPDYIQCRLVQAHPSCPQDEPRCPFLSVGDVFSCAAATFPKQISCNQTTLSRCTNEGHLYCDHFLSMSEAVGTAETQVETASRTDRPAGDIPMPADLAYAPNHMWFDPGNGHTWHVGLDAFFGRALGRVDEVVYPHHGNKRRPMVRIRAGGVDFDLAFPNVTQSVEINPHLVSDPSGILTDPYGRGWLFEGVSLPAAPGRDPADLARRLRRGPAAVLWMQEEWDRLGQFIREHAGPAADGPLTARLDRPALMRLHTEFFTLSSGRTAS